MRIIALIAAAVLTAMSGASAQSGRGISISQVRQIAKGFCDASDPALPCDESPGATAFRFNHGGMRYVVYFYGCENGYCRRVATYLGFFGRPGVSRDQYLKFANDWNNDRFGQAHIDSDDDPVLQDWVFAPSGLTDAQIRDFFAAWFDNMAEFRRRTRTLGRNFVKLDQAETPTRTVTRRGETFTVHDAALSLNEASLQGWTGGAAAGDPAALARKASSGRSVAADKNAASLRVD